jgi:hypothetical protein
MKTLKLIVAVVLLLGSYQLGMAQSNSLPAFKSDAEKQAWIQAHPDEYKAMQPAAQVKKQDANVRSEERFASEAEKKAWIKANRQQYTRELKATSTVVPANRKPAEPAKRRAAN